MTEKEVKQKIRHLGLRKVARQAGLHHNTVWNWVSGHSSTTLDSYNALLIAIQELEKINE